jgi:hypothetical protein
MRPTSELTLRFGDLRIKLLFLPEGSCNVLPVLLCVRRSEFFDLIGLRGVADTAKRSDVGVRILVLSIFFAFSFRRGASSLVLSVDIFPPRLTVVSINDFAHKRHMPYGLASAQSHLD